MEGLFSLHSVDPSTSLLGQKRRDPCRRSCCAPVPIAAPNETLRARERGTDNRIPIRPVRLAAVVLAPCCFVRVLVEKVTADSVMLANLGERVL